MKFEEQFPSLIKHELYSLAVDNGYSNAETKELQDLFRKTCLDKQLVKKKLVKTRELLKKKPWKNPDYLISDLLEEWGLDDDEI